MSGRRSCSMSGRSSRRCGARCNGRSTTGHRLVAGSSSPDRPLRTTSLYESGESNGAVSLAAVFAGDAPAALGPGVTVPHLVERIVTGGWPDLVGAQHPIDG